MPIRARDLRAHIMAMGFDKGIVHTLELLLEEHVGIRQDMVRLAELQSQMLGTMEQFLSIGDGMRQQLNEMKRRDEQYEAVRSEDPEPEGA